MSSIGKIKVINQSVSVPGSHIEMRHRKEKDTNQRKERMKEGREGWKEGGENGGIIAT